MYGARGAPGYKSADLEQSDTVQELRDALKLLYANTGCTGVLWWFHGTAS